jgi:hypothetical protein
MIDQNCEKLNIFTVLNSGFAIWDPPRTEEDTVSVKWEILESIVDVAATLLVTLTTVGWLAGLI